MIGHMRQYGKWSLLVVMLALGVAGCARQEVPTKESAVTPGMAKKFIKRGVTTQTDVLEIFGPPDLVTQKRGGTEVWTYDKVSHEVRSSSGYLTIILAGMERRRASSSSRSTMLIIYFDRRERVEDFALSAAKF